MPFPDLFSYGRDIILGRKKGKAVLWSLSQFFAITSHMRNLLYDLNIFRTRKVKPKVISVGSIVAGGTGKTPLLLKLLGEISGKKVAVLSRGYRSSFEHQNIIAAKGSGPIYSSEEMGDEPFLIAKRFPQHFVIVGKNRIRSAEIATKIGAEILLLDDGMQHRRIYRDVEIVTLKSDDLFGQRYFLPRGFLRDSPKRLKNAHAVIIDGLDSMNASFFRRELQPFTNAPLIGVKKRVIAFRDLSGNKVENISSCALFCGIANPESFVHVMKQQNLSLLGSLFLRDHQKAKPSQLEKFLESTGAKHLLCTEKDAVKQKFGDLPILWAEMDLEITYGRESWNLLVEKIHGKRE